MNDEARNRRLFIASFLTLIAAGMGFAIRANGILDEWGTTFGFTKADLGDITGFGLAGFGITIIAGSLFADRIGYKPLMILAFLLHVGSAVITLTASQVFAQYRAEKTKLWLFAGMTLFALANGVCEAVINPLVATLYPKQKTHYLNILHAGWPGGLILGAILAYLFVGNNAAITKLQWEISMGLFLIPTVIYGLMVLRDKFPESEAKAAGVDMMVMLTEFASPLLLFLFLLHAMVGYVELGTDSWIPDILNTVIAGKATLLFIYTSAIMFVLRFFAGPIVERINPIGLLFITPVLGATGLYWLGSTTTSDAVAAGEAGMAILIAATIYGVGKTFLWPTMLGVVGERFPKGGAMTMGTIGGIGMLSAGLLGGPAIGTKQDYFATQKLKETSPETYDRYVVKGEYSEKLGRFVDKSEQVNNAWPESFGPVGPKEKPKSFYNLFQTYGLDGSKVGKLKDKRDLADKAKATKTELKPEDKMTPEEEKDLKPVLDAGIYGGGMALKWTAFVPAMMAVGYLILVFYFRSKGGYQVEVLHGAKPEGEHYTGGMPGPME